MSAINRRQFLQFAGATLAALGLNQLDIQRQSIRYAQVLAQPTSRKRALLVGINQYEASLFTNLKGCVNDVQRQQELLVGRFGFNPADIRVLTDESPEKPTRDNILNAFEEHLIRSTQPGDVVVFHFSGHGSRITDPDPIRTVEGKSIPANGAFVPADSVVQAGAASDIMGRSLFLLMSAINTENVTVVLDCCYSGGGTRGNVRIRSARPANPSQIELDYQQRWLRDLAIAPEEFAQRRNAGVAKGVVLAAAQHNQEALDVTFGDVHAGAFTAFMTQYLWQQTEQVRGVVASVTRSLAGARLPQLPLSDVKAGSGFDQQPIYFTDTVATGARPPAEAVITSVQGIRGTVWLGGIDPDSLIAFGAGAAFIPAGVDGQPGDAIKLISRSGLVGEVSLPASLSAGTLLQEATRVIPSDLRLRIGLDPSLGADATTAQQNLRSLKRIEPVLPQASNTPYAGEVQYILSRMTPEYRQLLQQRGRASLPPEGSIGLFSQSIDEAIPDSFGEAGEGIDEAINRLSSKLTALVAARLVKLILNANASRLRLEASMQREDASSAIVGQAFTVRGSHRSSTAAPSNSRQLPVNTPFQFRIVNQEPSALYISILVVDPSGEITVLFPNQYAAAEDTTRIGANQTLLVPDPARDSFQFATESKGIGEALVIASRSPLRQALLALRNLAVAQQLPQRGAFVTPTVEAIGDLLSDLSNTRSSSSVSENAQLSAAEIAALSITFEVV